MTEQEFFGLINSRESIVSIIGIDITSIPLAVKLAENGFKVKLFSWEGGTIVFPGSDEMFAGPIGTQLNYFVSTGIITLTTSIKNAQQAHIYIVCEPPQPQIPNYDFIDKTDIFLRNLSTMGKLVIYHLPGNPDFIRTFTLPGLENIKPDIFWTVGDDFYLSVIDGKIFKSGGQIDYLPLMSLKGMTNSCYRLTENLYNQIGIELLKPVRN